MYHIVEEEGTKENVDLSQLSDDEQAERLREHGIQNGPIVSSTRAVYEKKLATVLNGSSEEEAPIESNGLGLKNGEFSADEERAKDDDDQPSVVVRKATTPLRLSARISPKAASSPLSPAAEDDDDKPSVVVRRAKPPLRRSARISSKAASIPLVPAAEVESSLRQRFGGDASSRGDRLTPTLRRSNHSITETTVESIVKSPDGKVSRDVEYHKETSESTRETGGPNFSVFSILTNFFFVLLLAGVAYFLFTNSLTGHGAVEAPAEPVEQAPEAVAVEEAPAQSAIGDI